jgi:hypothetical protein
MIDQGKHPEVFEFASFLEGLEPSDRVEAIGMIRAEFCDFCGIDHGSGQHCQCWNDE